jgi:hypothetical protein
MRCMYTVRNTTVFFAHLHALCVITSSNLAMYLYSKSCTGIKSPMIIIGYQLIRGVLYIIVKQSYLSLYQYDAHDLTCITLVYQ